MRYIIGLILSANAIAQTQQFDWITQIRNKPMLDTREYAWNRKSGTTTGPSGITGSLTTAGSKVINFNGCPAGILDGKSPNAHDLWISGGTGTPERVTISSTTCTKAGSPGQIVFNTVNAHTGSWVIQSATDGAQEAAYFLDGGGSVIIARSANYYGTVYVPARTAFVGDGRTITIITQQTDKIPTFKLVKDNVIIEKLGILYKDQNYGATAGSIGIESHYRTNDQTQQAFVAEFIDLDIAYFYTGIWIDGTAGSIDLRHVQARECSGPGIIAASAQGYWDTIMLIGNKGDGLRIIHTDPIMGQPPFLQRIQTWANGGWGIYTLAGLTMIDFFLNNDSSGELFIDSPALDSGYITAGNIQFAGSNPLNLVPNVPTAPGIRLTDRTTNVNISNVHFLNSNGNAIDGGLSSYNSFIGNLIQGAGLENQVGNVYCIEVNGSNNRFIENRCDKASKIDGTNNIIIGNTFSITSNTLAALEIVVGERITLDNNQFYNGGSAEDLKIGTGVKLIDGNNSLFSLKYTYNGQRDPTNATNNPTGFLSRQRIQFINCTNCIEGQAYWCLDCNPGSNCPSSAGPGSIAIYSLAQKIWVCK